MKKSIWKKLVALTVAGSLLASLAACGKTDGIDDLANSTVAAANGEEFVIGNAQPLTGVNALVGDASNKAAALAVKYINENGGFNGVPVRLVNYDDQGSPEEAVKIATKMIEVDKVDAILGSLTSSCVLAAGKYYNDAGIPTIGTGNSPTWMQQGWDYVFRATLNTALSMPFLTDKLVELGIESVAIFYGEDDAAKSSMQSFVKECEARGIKVLTKESYTEGDTDFSGQVVKIIRSKPDAVFCSTNGPTQAIFAKQLRQFGYEGICFNREAFPVDSLKVAGEAADYWAFSYPYVAYPDISNATDPDMIAFLEMYQEEYGELPFHDCAYRSWDSMMVFAEAARIAGSNEPDAIRDGINQIKDFKVLGGILDYTDGTGEGLHSMNTYVVLNEEYKDFDTWVEEGGYDALPKNNS